MRLVAVTLLQELQFARNFHALGNDAKPERMRHLDNRGHERAFTLRTDLAHERLVDVEAALAAKHELWKVTGT